ncbi:hypothetical protein U1Q18_000873 [Sarracenia purpurea var. burkii]
MKGIARSTLGGRRRSWGDAEQSMLGSQCRHHLRKAGAEQRRRCLSLMGFGTSPKPPNRSDPGTSGTISPPKRNQEKWCRGRQGYRSPAQWKARFAGRRHRGRHGVRCVRLRVCELDGNASTVATHFSNDFLFLLFCTLGSLEVSLRIFSPDILGKSFFDLSTQIL